MSSIKFLLTFPLSFLLHTIALFSRSWVKWEGCEAQGLIYSVSSNTANTCFSEDKYISLPALGLQMTSLALFLLISVWMLRCYQTFRLFLFSIVLYALAGLFIVMGCIMMSTIDVPGYSFGWSFYLCLFNGVYVILQVIIPCYVVYKAICELTTKAAEALTPEVVIGIFEAMLGWIFSTCVHNDP